MADYLNNQVDDTVSYSTLEQLMDVLLSDLVVLASLKFSDEVSSLYFPLKCFFQRFSFLSVVGLGRFLVLFVSMRLEIMVARHALLERHF